MATLKDIAKKLNISAMTVSRAINNPEKVNKELLEKIYEQMEQMEYKPNQAARSLASNKTGVIHVVIPELLGSTDPYFMTLLAGIADYLSNNYYSLMVGTDFDRLYKCDGMIIMGLNQGEDTTVLTDLNLPCVLFGKTNLSIDYVDVNNRQGMYLATKHLIEQGHTDIAFVAIKHYEFFSKERLEGYKDALAEHNIEIKDELIFYTDNNIKSGKDIGDWILSTSKVSAILCSSDILAVGVMEAAKELNINIPNDISLMGFDGIYVNKLVIPHLTTIVQPVYELGIKLAETILNRINNIGIDQQVSIYDLTIELGETTRKI